MPKRKVDRTIRARGKGKGKRDAAVRSMASSSMRGATSVANSTINRRVRKPRPSLRRNLNRGDALVSMMGSMGSGMGVVGKAAYDTSMPMIKGAAESVGQSVSKFVSGKRVPTVHNNPAWVDLKAGLTKGLINLGLLEDDDPIDPAIYFQSVEAFLDTHKGVMINLDDIRGVTRKLKAMDLDDDGDTRTAIMQNIFEGGIKQDSIIAALEYEFRKKIIPSDSDMDLSMSSPGKGFQGARDKTAKKQKMAKIVNLARGIEIMLGTDDKLGHYKSIIEESFKELTGLIITDEEFKVLQKLVKKYPQLNSLMPAALKKKNGKKGKKSGRKRSKRKRTGRR